MTTAASRPSGLDALSPYVQGNPTEALCQADFIRLAGNENPLGPSPKVMAARAGALSHLNCYPDAEAHALRQALARRLAVRPDRIRVGNGADDSPDYPDSLRYVREGRKNVIVLRTFSKVYGIAGIRLGYGIGEPEALNPLWTASDCANKASRQSDHSAGMPAVADVMLPENGKKASRIVLSRGRSLIAWPSHGTVRTEKL